MAVLKNIVSKIFNLSTTPAKKTEGQFWYDTTNNVLKRSDGTDYKPLPVGDNLISAGSTDTIKGILDSKANASDLTNYLQLTGGIIQNTSLQGSYNKQTTTTLNGNYIEIANRVTSKPVWTTIKPNSIRIDSPDDDASTSITTQSITTGNGIGSSFLINSSIASAIFASDSSQYAVTIGALGNGAYNGSPQETGDFYGLNIGHCDTGEFDISSVNTFSSTIFKAGYTLNEDLEYIPEISGSLVDKTISSSSLDTHIPTSKAVYTSLQSKADNTNVVHLSGAEVITGNKLFTSSIKFSSFIPDTFNTNLAGVSVPDFGNPGTPPTLIIDRSSNITIDASNMTDSGLNYEYNAYGIISGVNWHGETFRIDGKHGSASFSSLNVGSISGSAVVSTLGTSTTSSKLPTEGAVVKAISDVKTSLGSALTYEGSVENYSNLPTGLTASDKGKVYNVVNANGDIPAGTNYAWNGTSWDALGGELSAYQLKTDDSLTTTSKQIVGAINEINLKLDITTGPTPITSVYTVDSTALKAFITDTQYANIQGKISISPSIDNVGAVYFGQSITDKSQAFPLYPGQIMSFSFTDINTFMCTTDTVGNKFNYVIEFGVVNKEPVMDYGIIIRSATGENYRLTPVTDENGIATLELESLAKIDSEQLAKYFEESTPNVKELTLVNGSEESQTVLQDKQGNILYTV